MHPKYAHIGSIESRVIEECAELTKDICKALRFGWDDFNPHTPNKTNRINALGEIADVRRVIDELESHLTGGRAALAAMPKTEDELSEWLVSHILESRVLLEDMPSDHHMIGIGGGAVLDLHDLASRLAESGVTVPGDELNQLFTMLRQLNIPYADYVPLRDKLKAIMEKVTPPADKCRWTWHKDEVVSYWQIGCISPSEYGCAAYAFPQHLSFESFQYCPFCGKPIEGVRGE